jgi:LmbE family N-acetylglucosaminyl deacetylase
VSVEFHHLELGTPEAAWAADGRLVNASGRNRSLQLAAPGAGTRVVVVAAHPDDESLGAGGLIASAAAAGARVHVIVASNGEASHPGSPTHSAGRLAEIRRHEVRAAVAELDPAAGVTLLDLPDGRLREHARELVDAIATHLADRVHGGGGILLVTPWRGDRHPDHEACAQAGTDAVNRVTRAHENADCTGTDDTSTDNTSIDNTSTDNTSTSTDNTSTDITSTIVHWQYPIWLWHWAATDAAEVPWSRLGILGLDPLAQQAKSRAVACHLSQHGPLSDRPGDEAILPPRLVAHFARSFETFVLASDSETAP